MQQDNTYSVDPNNTPAQMPENPPVANPLNTGNGGFETPTPTETASPEATFPQVPTPEMTTPEATFPQVPSAETPDNQPHPIEIQAAPEMPAQPTEPPVTEIPAAENSQPEVEAAQPATETAPEFPSQPAAEAPQPPVVPSITDNVQSGESMPMANAETTHQESKVKSYILASVLVVGLSAFGFIGYKFFFTPSGTVTDEITEESVELTNSLSSSTSEETTTTEETPAVEETSITEETTVAPEVDKMEELDAVVSELKEIYSPESEVSEEAVLTEVGSTEGGVDR